MIFKRRVILEPPTTDSDIELESAILRMEKAKGKFERATEVFEEFIKDFKSGGCND